MIDLSTDEAGPEEIARHVRGQWWIENRSHYVRDKTFDEDRSQVRVGGAPQTLTTLRNLTISILLWLRDDVAIAKDDLETARASMKGVPAMLAANEIDPGAKRARPHLAAQALQMVCRLLAYNAELDLARRLNTYLADDDEYRAITRNLLHLGGLIAFERRRIVVTLDRP